MTVKRVEELIEAAREANPELWISGPVSEDAITTLEGALGVILPPSYRFFLTRYGGLATSERKTVSGIVESDPLLRSGGSIYSDTLTFREEYGLPERFLVLQPDQDAPYCFDTEAASPDGELTIVCYQLHSASYREIAGSFSEWLETFFFYEAQE